jgi:hypothetical protein
MSMRTAARAGQGRWAAWPARRRRARLAAAGAALLIAAVAAACDGSGRSAGSPAAANGSSPAASPVTPAGTGTAGARAAGPVPAGFAASSVTFVSPGEAFVLGTSACASAPCTTIAHTRNRGMSWTAVPAPRVPVGAPALSGGPAVWGIRFATPAHGFVFGSRLWETTDGGAHWARPAQPPGLILSLATADGQVLALTSRCTPAGGCAAAGTLLRRPLAGGGWQAVAAIRYPGLTDPTDLIATQAGAAAVIDGTRVLVTRDGGVTRTARPGPCAGLPAGAAVSVAVTSATGLALLCGGQGFTGHTVKRVYLSGDDGAHWRAAGTPATVGDGGTIAAATPTRLTIATMSAASWLFWSGDSAAHWSVILTALDGGFGWADLGFTTPADGVVVHGPAVTDRNRERRPGQLLLTGDGGATWRAVRL